MVAIKEFLEEMTEKNGHVGKRSALDEARAIASKIFYKLLLIKTRFFRRDCKAAETKG